MAEPEWRVPYVDLRGEFRTRKDRYIERFVDVCADARFILRKEVDELEAELAKYLGVTSCVGVGSGSDAILLALHAIDLKPGDEVITVAHTFVATLAAIHFAGGKPVVVDIREDFNMDPAALAKAITPKTRAVVPVHMNGRCCDMHAIREICAPRGIKIIEDAAQALGSKVDGVAAGAHGELGAFSFHPMKTLHCFGDGGLVTTNDAALGEKIRLLRNHGQRSRTDLAFYGYNSRLDTLQAAILLENLKHLASDIEQKRAIASQYEKGLAGIEGLVLPPSVNDKRFFDTFTSYVVRTARRDALREHLLREGIEVFVHGDPPLTHQKTLALKASIPTNDRVSREILSLPVFPQMRGGQVELVVRTIRDFFGAS